MFATAALLTPSAHTAVAISRIIIRVRAHARMIRVHPRPHTAVAISRIILYNVDNGEYRYPVRARSTQGDAHADTELAGRVRGCCGHRCPLLSWRRRSSPGAVARWRWQSWLAAASSGPGRAV